MPESWEKRETETPKAFAAFCAYRDLGPERSIEKVGQKLGKSKALIERWSRKHEWVSRVVAYDVRLESKVRAETETEKVRTNVEFITAAKKRLFAELEKPDGDWRAAIEALKRLCRHEWGDSLNVSKFSDEELIARTAAALGGDGEAGTHLSQ